MGDSFSDELRPIRIVKWRAEITMGRTSGSKAIYNRNWLSYQLMKAALLVWLILLKGNRAEVKEALKGNARVLNTKKNGYEAEAHFLRLVVLIEFFLVAGAAFTTSAIVILAVLVTGEEVISTYYVFYVSLIPFALMIVHTWKSVNLEIIKARKLPYRLKSGYFTEVRNSDLVPSIIIFAIVIVSTIAYYWG